MSYVLQCIWTAFDARLRFGISIESSENHLYLRLDLSKSRFGLGIVSFWAEKYGGVFWTCSSSTEAHSMRPILEYQQTVAIRFPKARTIQSCYLGGLDHFDSRSKAPPKTDWYRSKDFNDSAVSLGRLPRAPSVLFLPTSQGYLNVVKGMGSVAVYQGLLRLSLALKNTQRFPLLAAWWRF